MLLKYWNHSFPPNAKTMQRQSTYTWLQKPETITRRIFCPAHYTILSSPRKTLKMRTFIATIEEHPLNQAHRGESV